MKDIDPARQVMAIQRVQHPKATSSILTAKRNKTKVIKWIARGHWWVVGLGIAFLLSIQAFDVFRHQIDFIHLIAYNTLLILLLVAGLMLEGLLQEIKQQTRASNVLEFKHSISMEFSRYYDWDVLIDQLARFPSTVAGVDQSYLFISGYISNQFKAVAQWTEAGEDASDLSTIEVCRKVVGNRPGNYLRFGQCELGPSTKELFSQSKWYCRPIRFGKNLLGILQFRLKPGTSLTQQQFDLFNNIGDELAVALKVGQDRRLYYEMRATETALAERRTVSNYLHDHLGQSLGFLHFKIDQLLTDKDQLSLNVILNDLEHLRDAANDSYRIVRGILETTHPETTPLLTNLLSEHARKVGQRAGIKIDFKINGKPISLPTDTQRAIFYAFEESVSNIEKHARATKIDIVVEWSRDVFTLTIADDGVGFNPQFISSEQHFGLEILNERMAKVNGRVTLSSTENSGTIVHIDVPSRFGEGQE